KNTEFVYLLARKLPALAKDADLLVRVRASWAVANLGDTLLADHVKGENRVLDELSEDIYCKLMECALLYANDNEKCRKKVMTSIIQNIESGPFKVRWNSCYAAYNIFQSPSFLSVHAQCTALPRLISALARALVQSKNYKVRINAAMALSAPGCGVQIYGGVQEVERLVGVLESAMESVDDLRDTSFGEYRYRDQLNKQLSLQLIMSRVRVVIPRPPNHFAEWIPEFALRHSTRLSLPDYWHMRANQVWLFPIVAMFVCCVLQRRWLPSQWKESRIAERVLVGVEDHQLLDGKKADDAAAAPIHKKESRWTPSWTLWLFWLMLATHALYYVVEIDSTQMLRANKGMAYHHFASYVVFFGYAKNANDICVLTLVPFVIHCIYWSFFGTTTVETHTPLTLSILVLYNVALLVCGSVSFVMFFALENAYSRGRVPVAVRKGGATLKAIMTHPTDLLMPLTCVAIGAVNYSIYCTMHSGSVCGAAGLFDADLGKNHRVWSCIAYVVWVSLSSLVGVVLGRSQWFGRLLKGDPRLLEGFTETRYQLVEGGPYQGGGRLSPIGAMMSWFGFGGIHVEKA
ncbi:HEAT repeat-containing protein 6, partial [Chytriomyces hyalinus]